MLGGSDRGQLAIELAQHILARGDQAGEIAAQSRRGPCVAGRPTLHGAPRDAEIVRQAGMPVLPIESGTDAAEKVRAHLAIR